jgi:glycosyltransferase involved in cell wall biosynthesis
MKKLGVITSHPIQYHAPWFRHLAQERQIDLKVFYLWDFGVTERVDNGFKHKVQWDVPLLQGYEHEFVENVSSRPGTTHFRGLRNPSLTTRVSAWNPDVVLFIGYNYASFYRFLIAWDRYRAPLIFRGDSHRLVPQAGFKALARQTFISTVFRRFQAFLYVGASNREYFLYHHVPQDRLFFAPHAVDNERFAGDAQYQRQQAASWREELGIEESQIVILFAGKFEAKKRPLDLLQAFREVDPPQATLLFAGAGELETELRRASHDHPRVRFAPFQNQSLMPRTYAAADLFVLPSCGPDETWGLAVNEAMCCGCAIIVSNQVGCAADLVHPLQNGLQFSAGNIAELSACLREALADRERLRHWGDASRSIVSDYSYDQTTQGLMEAIRYVRR